MSRGGRHVGAFPLRVREYIKRRLYVRKGAVCYTARLVLENGTVTLWVSYCPFRVRFFVVVVVSSLAAISPGYAGAPLYSLRAFFLRLSKRAKNCLRVLFFRLSRQSGCGPGGHNEWKGA